MGKTHKFQEKTKKDNKGGNVHPEQHGKVQTAKQGVVSAAKRAPKGSNMRAARGRIGGAKSLPAMGKSTKFRRR